MIVNDSDLCKDTDHINGFSIIINKELTRLGNLSVFKPDNSIFGCVGGSRGEI